MDSTPPTPYPDLNTVLEELVASVRIALAGNFVAAWLQGSFAVGGFDLHSDVDFIIAVSQELSAPEVASLQAVHHYLYELDNSWATHLEGSYFPRAVLREYTPGGPDLWYLDHGSKELVKSRHDNTAVVRWILREKGGVLAGPKPSELIDPVPVETLRREILTRFTDWGKQILANPERIGSRWYQSFAVLSYCRMLHDLHTGVIGSKRSGAEWAKANLDPCWIPLIDRAWGGRPNPAVSAREPADPEDLASTLEFIKVVLKTASELAADLHIG